jgi:hypothetical protein
MPGSAVDCNVNFVPDACDVTSGTSSDSNSNGIPDECESTFILSGRSCRSHGASDFCLDLGPGDGQATELRVGGVNRLELDMSTPLDAASVTPGHVQIDCGTHGYGGTILAWLLNDTTITIDLQPGLLDLECCEVRLDGMVSQVGLPITNIYRVATLMGDANRDGAVTAADSAGVKQRLGMVVDSSNFVYDVNADGWITTADYASVKQRLGNVVPSCPE